ncbi:unnamed protein product [Echinostoma caproni]|uniref:ARM repeat superfamily protein n=1 Tax=Echinostoma caproni TaxID=27848 RepID=A0A183B203_9TREM|nr:unnamed protein product [Echinostoma caproni]
MLGSDTYNNIESIWLDSHNCGRLPSANIQLARRLTSGIFRTTNNEQPIDRRVSNITYSNISHPQTKRFTSMSNGKIDIKLLRFEDISLFLCRASFEILMAVVHRDSQGVAQPQLNLLFLAEELKENVARNLSTTSGWKQIFGWSSCCDSTSWVSEIKRLTENRTFLGLLGIIKMFSADLNFNVVLCSLDVAAVLLNPLYSFGKSCELKGGLCDQLHTNESHFAWLVTSFLCLLFNGFSDGKLVVRVAATKLALLLARLPGAPMLIIRHFCGLVASSAADHLEQSEKNIRLLKSANVSQNSRLVQEAIDLVTTLLLTLPSADFNISEVCQMVVKPGLLDENPLVSYLASGTSFYPSCAS